MQPQEISVLPAHTSLPTRQAPAGSPLWHSNPEPQLDDPDPSSGFSCSQIHANKSSSQTTVVNIGALPFLEIDAVPCPSSPPFALLLLLSNPSVLPVAYWESNRISQKTKRREKKRRMDEVKNFKSDKGKPLRDFLLVNAVSKG